MADPRLCSVQGCDKRHYGRGWCHTHYMRWWTGGDANTLFSAKGKSLRWVNDVACAFDGSECLVWPFDRSKKGYGRIYCSGRKLSAARFILELTAGPAPSPDLDCAHSCGNGAKGCVNPRHLRWATRQENILDKIGHGTICRGVKNTNAKLTDKEVLEIRRLAETEILKDVAERFGVAISTVHSIKMRKTWGWL